MTNNQGIKITGKMMQVVCSTFVSFEIIVSSSGDVKPLAVSPSSSHVKLERDVKESTY